MKHGSIHLYMQAVEFRQELRLSLTQGDLKIKKKKKEEYANR